MVDVRPLSSKTRAMQLAYIKDESGFEAGLRFQISPHIEHFASLVWSFPFGEIFYAPLRRATDRFDPYGICEIPSPCWIEIARAAEEWDDRLRADLPIPDDIRLFGGGELVQLLENSGGRRRCLDALRLTSYWLRKAAAEYPTLTFYGV